MNFRSDSLSKLDDIQRTFSAAVSRPAAVAIAIDLAHFCARNIREGRRLMLRSRGGTVRQVLIPGVME